MPSKNEAVQQGNVFVAEMPSKPKKLTATRLGKVLNLNHWATPFQAWCEVMRVAEPPFEDTKYTLAGKAIEPKLIQFARERVSPYIVQPEDYFDSMDWRYDFYPENYLFGGMWDGLAFDRGGVTEHDEETPIAIIECKTSSRPQDWENGVPDHYKIQGMLYAYMSGCEDVYFPVAFLEPSDYDSPEDYTCDESNCRIFHVTVADRINGKTIEELLEEATAWWESYVEGGVSPTFDLKKDKEYLSILTQMDLSELDTGDEDIESLSKELRRLDNILEMFESDPSYVEAKKQRKAINSKIQGLIKPLLVDVDGKDSVTTDEYIFKISPTRKCDYDKMEQDGVLDLYVTTDYTIRTAKR